MVSTEKSVPPEALTRHREALLSEMRATLAERSLPLYDMARYALGWQAADGEPLQRDGGKAIRPAICLLGAAAIDAAPAAHDRALPGAAAVEFVHNFSLVHDDLQDRDDERHGRATVWRVWGEAQAINGGDALRELADFALRRAREAGASAETVLGATARLNAAALEMIEGQYLDLRFEEDSQVGLHDYLTMIERKTGAMMGVSLALGGLLAGASDERADALDRAGRRLGRCFQIQDDYLGVWGDSAATGKSTDNDIRRRKKAFPIVHALEHGAPELCQQLQSYYRRDEDLHEEEIGRVQALLEEAGAGAAAKKAAAAEHAAFDSALQACEPLPIAGAELREIGAFLVQRDR